MVRRIAASLAVTFCSQSVTLAQTATVNVGGLLRTSELTLGITHTHAGVDQSGADPVAAARAKLLLANSHALEATQSIGWGIGDINPSPGVYNWSTFDTRINLMNSIDATAEKEITLCTAPARMKARGDTFAMGDKPTAAHFQDFADLAVQIAKRYPTVRKFQVWNEFKGFYNADPAVNNWDAPAYTQFYNTVYTALKAYDPTLQVGGFYLVVSGTGSNKPTSADTYVPFGTKDRAVLDYWLANKAGADFISVDRGIKDFHDNNAYTVDELLSYTPYFASVVSQIKAKTNLPVSYAEYYSLGSGTEQQRSVAMASIYGHMVRAGTDSALMWNPIEGETSVAMITDVNDASGGRPTDRYRAFRTIQDYFGKGKSIYNSTSSATTLESLISAEKMMLINKGNTATSVTVGSKTYELDAYDFQTFRRTDLTRKTLALSDDFADGTMTATAGTSNVRWYRNTGNSAGNWKVPATGNPFGTDAFLQFAPTSDQQDHLIVASLPSAVTVTATTGVRLRMDYQDPSNGGGLLSALRIGLFKGAAVTSDAYPKAGDSSTADPTQDW